MCVQVSNEFNNLGREIMNTEKQAPVITGAYNTGSMQGEKRLPVITGDYNTGSMQFGCMQVKGTQMERKNEKK